MDYFATAGHMTLNISIFVQGLADHINSITRPNYMIIKCARTYDPTDERKIETTDYTCGRALYSNIGEGYCQTRFIIFNTISVVDDSQDTLYLALSGYPDSLCTEKKIPSDQKTQRSEKKTQRSEKKNTT